MCKVDLENTAKEASILLQEKHLKTQLKQDVQRGFYQLDYLFDKYVDTREFIEIFNRETVTRLLNEVLEEVQTANAIDIPMEISSYLVSNMKMQETLFEMLDESLLYPNPKAPRKEQMDIVKEIRNLKNDRIEFMVRVGMPLQKSLPEGDPAKTATGINLTELTKKGTELLQLEATSDDS